MKKLNKKRKGFTLVELIVVIVILGILMGIGALKYADVKRGANLRTLQTNHKTLVSAVQLQVAANAGKAPSGFDKNAMLALAEGIADGKPVGTVYDYVAGTGDEPGTVSVTVSAPGNNYPKNGTANVNTITISTNLADGTTTYAPDPATAADYWK